MSHILKLGEDNSEDEIMFYLNGYLGAIEVINSFMNDGKTIYIKKLLVQKNESIEQIILAHLRDSDYKVTKTLADNFTSRLLEIIPFYVETYIHQFNNFLQKSNLKTEDKLDFQGDNYSNSFLKLREEFNGEKIIDRLVHLISLLATTNDTVYEINVDWSNGAFYEGYHHDFVIANKGRIYFLHFGGSD